MPGPGSAHYLSLFWIVLLLHDSGFRRSGVTAYEIDASLRDHLSRTLADHKSELDIDISVFPGDFIEAAGRLILEGKPRFSHAIMNPPYKKINSGGRHRLLLRQVGIETVNLYSAFVALTINLMQRGGEIVAIIPRSFCNGPYYRPFRELILAKTAINECICLAHAIGPSKMMTFCRKISSSCWSAAAHRVVLLYLHRQTTNSPTLRPTLTPLTR